MFLACLISTRANREACWRERSPRGIRSELFDLRYSVLVQSRDECLLGLSRKHFQQRADRLLREPLHDDRLSNAGNREEPPSPEVCKNAGRHIGFVLFLNGFDVAFVNQRRLANEPDRQWTLLARLLIGR